MIKILSGEFKGRKLNRINFNSIRPTQAKVRKSIMDSIRKFDNKTILDLYSGAGTLGIESLSRGANFVCFVENDIKAIRVLNSNIEMLNLNSACKIVKSDAIKFLKKHKEMYDLIFADPPYETCKFYDILPYISKLLKKEGTFCFESQKDRIEKDENIKIKHYGNTQIVFWEKRI